MKHEMSRSVGGLCDAGSGAICFQLLPALVLEIDSANDEN